jgi:hypothetical protein
MSIQTPPAKIPPTPPESDSEIEAGVIKDARARQRRHRRIGGLLVAAAIGAGALIAGIAGGGGGAGSGGHAGGQPAGSGAGGGAVHASVSNAFPGAPATQANGYGVETDLCPLAPPNRYLPARSGCVTVRRVDVNGDGKPDLILAYSRLGRRHPYSYAGQPSSLRRDFPAKAAFLKVVLAGGTSVSTRINETKPQAVAIDAIAHVNDEPGSEIFLETGRISSGATGVAYGFHDGRLVPAGVMLGYGGDSAAQADFNCLPGNPPRFVQRSFELIGPNVSSWWQETAVTYAWHGPKLVKIASRTFKRYGALKISNQGIGHGCAIGI